MKYEKGSFVVVPNKNVLIGMEAGAQALYMWLCDFANTEGDCFPSRATLATRLGCSVRTIDTYLVVLLLAGLVVKEHRFKGNEKISNNYYLPVGGSAKSALPSAESAPPLVQNLPIELNPTITQPTQHGATAPIEVVVDKPRPDKSHLPVFGLFSTRKQGWMMHPTQIKAAKRLIELRGWEQVQKAMAWYGEHKDDPYMVEIHTPYDLEAKWPKLYAKSQK